MKEGTGRKKRAWFWTGVVLLSISALLWLVLIAVMIAEPEDRGSLILAGVIVTALPVGIGTYGITRGRKARVAKIQKAGRATYATQHVVKPAHEGMTEQKKLVLVVIIGLIVTIGVLVGTGLYDLTHFTETADHEFDVGDQIVFTGSAKEGRHAVVLDKDDDYSWAGGGGMGVSGRAYLLKFDDGTEQWLSQKFVHGYAKKLKPD